MTRQEVAQAVREILVKGGITDKDKLELIPDEVTSLLGHVLCDFALAINNPPYQIPFRVVEEVIEGPDGREKTEETSGIPRTPGS